MPALELDAERLISEGKDAWSRLEQHQTQAWDDWKAVGFALDHGRQFVLNQLGTDVPKGRWFNTRYGGWLKEHGFGSISQSSRSMLAKCMGELVAIEEWREWIGPGRAVVYNHPDAVWRAFSRHVGGRGRQRSDGAGRLLDFSTPEAMVQSARRLVRVYGEETALQFCDAILELVDQVPAPAEEPALALVAAPADAGL